MGVKNSKITDPTTNSWVDFFNRLKQKPIEIAHRSRVIKSISWRKLWDNFFQSSLTHFALTPPELIALLEVSYNDEYSDTKEISTEVIKAEIAEYVEFILELSAQPKVIDFLAVCSSTLIVSDDHLEAKLDMLFQWLDLNIDGDINCEELYIGLSSFEKGLSYALGQAPTSEKYLEIVAQQWFSLFGTGREDIQGEEKVGKIMFLEFSTNRQQAVRKIIEAFVQAKVTVDKTGDIQEITTKSLTLKEPTGLLFPCYVLCSFSILK
jgi:Ca2+-binding EF-hand superfamily protein